MPSFRTAQVIEVVASRPGLQRLRVRVEGAAGELAYCLTDLVGEVAAGDPVIVNTTAVELGLGTGGWHVVHWNLARGDFERPGPEHIMKLRYTSLQTDAGTDELLHEELPDTLGPVPVVVCTVHSQIGVVAATIAARSPGTRVAYVMTDGGALPLVLSEMVHELRSKGLLATTVTCGHAFGGDLEAVTPAAGMLLAHHVAGAEVILVGMGPGVVGTGTRYGTSAVEGAAVLDAAATLGGEPVLCVRASDGDQRGRHRGVSHHAVTVASLAHCHPWVAPVPPEVATLPGVRPMAVSVPDPAAILAGAGLRITTMGRDVNADPLFFRAAAAAAAVAVELRATPYDPVP